MNRKFKIFLYCAIGFLCCLLCVFLVVYLLHKRNVTIPVETSTSAVVDTVAPTDEEVLGPGHDTETSTIPIQHESYNTDLLEESVESLGVVYNCGILDFIDATKFSSVLLSKYQSVSVDEYNGGRYGIFNVRITTESGTYQGVWDDGAGVWYENAEDYIVQ